MEPTRRGTPMLVVPSRLGAVGGKRCRRAANGSGATAASATCEEDLVEGPPARSTLPEEDLGEGPPRRTFAQVLLTGPHPPVLRSWAQVLLPAELSAQPRARARAVAGARGAAGGATGMPERRRACAWPPVQLRWPEVPTSPNVPKLGEKQ